MVDIFIIILKKCNIYRRIRLRKFCIKG